MGFNFIIATNTGLILGAHTQNIDFDCLVTIYFFPFVQ